MRGTLFFLASGYLLARKIEWPYDSESSVAKIKKYLCKIGKMYLLWTLVYAPIVISHYVHMGASFEICIKDYIRGFLFVGEHYNSYMLWYLLSTIFALLLILFLLKWHVTPEMICMLGVLIFLLSYGIDSVVSYNGEMPSFLLLVKRLVQNTIASGRVLTGCFYIPVGMLLAHKKFSVKMALVLLLVGGIGNYYMDGFVGKMMVVVSAIGIFCLSVCVELKKTYVYVCLRHMSLVIYLIHLYLWTIYCEIMYGQKTFGMDCFWVTMLSSIIIAAIYVGVKGKDGKHELVDVSVVKEQ